EGGEKPGMQDVDVVTTATRAVMSGTYAVLSFPVAEPHTFLRASRAWLEGVPAQVGPCPNERLGLVDLMIMGTAHSRDRPRYGGGHLFRDLAAGQEVSVEVETGDGREISAHISLDRMPQARLFGTRHCFRNYSAFVNPGQEEVSTIFHATGFHPRLGGASFSGCGHMSPLQNDPLLETVGVGTRILFNGGEGFVLGAGTRSSPARPNLATMGDLHLMHPEYMGGFSTPAGPECVVSLALAVPVVSVPVLQAATTLDRDIPLPVMDVNTRSQMGEADYGQAWGGADLAVKFRPRNCQQCQDCRAKEACPTAAISVRDGRPRLDRKACFNCGLCSTTCPGQVFQARLGSIRVGETEVPIVIRQSDRLRALRLARDLKRRIVEGTFTLSEPVSRIVP
ncbi:MAG: methanogenesis marker 16 metalloprotein, partial [Methanosarcinales archaeon]|nr:methanogenesis marker 16 metalloprotein [Methanosarcinales archaeon]